MKKGIAYTVLSVALAVTLLCCAYFYTEYANNQDYVSKLRGRIELMEKQIEARNGVIDKKLGINLNDPTSLSENYEEIVSEIKKKKSGIIIEDSDLKDVTVPLYTPDGYYFGAISYAAYSAIMCNELQKYECADENEMQILHSYMNYITLNPGMSLVRYFF